MKKIQKWLINISVWLMTLFIGGGISQVWYAALQNGTIKYMGWNSIGIIVGEYDMSFRMQQHTQDEDDEEDDDNESIPPETVDITFTTSVTQNNAMSPLDNPSTAMLSCQLQVENILYQRRSCSQIDFTAYWNDSVRIFVQVNSIHRSTFFTLFYNPATNRFYEVGDWGQSEPSWPGSSTPNYENGYLTLTTPNSIVDTNKRIPLTITMYDKNKIQDIYSRDSLVIMVLKKFWSKYIPATPDSYLLNYSTIVFTARDRGQKILLDHVQLLKPWSYRVLVVNDRTWQSSYQTFRVVQWEAIINPPNNDYRPPNNDYNPPNSNYIPPGNSYIPPNNDYRPPSNNYNPPNSNYIPPGNSYTPPNNDYRPPNNIWNNNFHSNVSHISLDFRSTRKIAANNYITTVVTMVDEDNHRATNYNWFIRFEVEERDTGTRQRTTMRPRDYTMTINRIYLSFQRNGKYTLAHHLLFRKPGRYKITVYDSKDTSIRGTRELEVQ